jgi:capsular polysaccharide biosynthesis protein
VDFWKTIVVLVRRWYVALPALVVSLLLAAMVFQSIPPKYQSTGSVVLLTPPKGASASSKDPATNPLLNFGGSLQITAQLVTQVLLSPETATQMAAAGGGTDYQVGDADTGGPFINVVATASSAAQAKHTVELLLQTARQDLIDRQTRLGAPKGSFIAVEDAVVPTDAIQLNGNRLRGAAAALALGLCASLASAFIIESILESRQQRRGGKGRRRPDKAGAAGGTGGRAGIPATPVRTNGVTPAPISSDLTQPIKSPRQPLAN